MPFESFPFVIGWELTLACNIRCLHCASSAAGARKNELSLKEALYLCDQFPDLLVQEVDFTGGEALLYPHWYDIATYLNRLGITTRILSNGSLLTDDVILKIVDAGIHTVGISIDGLDKTHDYIRGCKGLFNKAINAIERINKNKKLKVSVISTINALNLTELPSLYELLNDLNVDSWQIQPIFPMGRCQKASELHLTKSSYFHIKDFLHKYLEREDNNDMPIYTADGLGYFSGIDKSDERWSGCSAGIASCAIMSDGSIKGCLSLPDNFIEGNVREKNLWDVWFKEDVFSYTRQFISEKAGPYCSTCDKLEKCKGGCTVMSYGNTGKLHNDPYCFYRLQKERKEYF